MIFSAHVFFRFYRLAPVEDEYDSEDDEDPNEKRFDTGNLQIEIEIQNPV